MWGRPDLVNNRFHRAYVKEAEDYIIANNLGDSSLYSVGLPYTAFDARQAVGNLYESLIGKGLLSKITLTISPKTGNSISYTGTLTVAETTQMNAIIRFYQNELS